MGVRAKQHCLRLDWVEKQQATSLLRTDTALKVISALGRITIAKTVRCDDVADLSPVSTTRVDGPS